MAEDKAQRVDHIDVRVEQGDDGGWVVVGVIDGERKEFGDPHASKDEAEHFADHMFAGADRWTGAAREVEPDPVGHPTTGQEQA